MDEQFKLVARVGHATCKGFLDGIVIARDIGCKEQSSGASLLPSSMSKVANGALHGSGIADNAAQRLEIIWVVEHLGDVDLLDEQEFGIGERGVLAHHTKVVARFALLRHHLVVGVYVEQRYW